MRADQFAGKEKALRAALAQATGRLAGHFANEAAAESAAAYLQSLLSNVERKNAWQLAEVAGLESPYRFQHLTRTRSVGGRCSARRTARGGARGPGGRRRGAGHRRETGFSKQGKKSVGVKRQYTGTTGKIDNCQIGVFLSWQTSRGHALIDRALYLPQEWAEDKERRRGAGVPGEVAFATKPALARAMLARVLAAGARPAWVVGDCVYRSGLPAARGSGRSRTALRGSRHGPAVRVAGLGPAARQDHQEPSARRSVDRDPRGHGHQGAASF